MFTFLDEKRCRIRMTGRACRPHQLREGRFECRTHDLPA
jgi:hypothetical protein